VGQQRRRGAGGVTQVVECPCNKHEFKPHYYQKNKIEKEVNRKGIFQR
jgi:hypothetical protein